MPKTVHFHHPLEEIDEETGQPHLQAPCANPDECHVAGDQCDGPNCNGPHRAELDHEHDVHAAVEVVGRHGVIFRVCPNGHQVDKLVLHPLTPLSSLEHPACIGSVDEQGKPVECDKSLEYVKQVPAELRPALHNPDEFRSTTAWPGR